MFHIKVHIGTGAHRRKTMPETEANEANFQEIRGHLDIIKAKLAKPTDRDTRESLKEDLEDYYERALQLRVMQNQTQAEELKEQTTKAQQLARYAYRNNIKVVVLSVVTVLMLAELILPGLFMVAVSSPAIQAVCSHVVVAIVVLMVAAMAWR